VTGITDVEFAGRTKTPLLLASGDNGVIQCWQTAGGEQDPIVPNPACALHGHGDIISSLSVARSIGAEGETEKKQSGGDCGTALLSSSWDRTIKLWDLATSAVAVSTWSGHPDQVNRVKWNAIDPFAFASGGKGGYVLCWDTRQKDPTGGLRLSDGFECTTIDTHPSLAHAVLYGSSEGVVREVDTRVWKPAEGGVVTTHGEAVTCLRYSPDGERVASAAEDRTLVVSPSTVATYEEDTKKSSEAAGSSSEKNKTTAAVVPCRTTLSDFASAVEWTRSSPDGAWSLLSSCWDKSVRAHGNFSIA